MQLEDVAKAMYAEEKELLIGTLDAIDSRAHSLEWPFVLGGILRLVAGRRRSGWRETWKGT